MITTERREILHLLERLSELSPDMRFGQLIVNLSYLARGVTAEAIYDMEDDELVAAIRRLTANLAELEGRTGAEQPATVP